MYIFYCVLMLSYRVEYLVVECMACIEGGREGEREGRVRDLKYVSVRMKGREGSLLALRKASTC